MSSSNTHLAASSLSTPNSALSPPHDDDENHAGGGSGGGGGGDVHKLLLVAGPTAVGKSDVAAHLCRAVHGWIVSADSVQVYRGVSIGANKPTVSELEETPHLLIDVVEDPHVTYNAADWRWDALHVIQRLLQVPPHNNNTLTNAEGGDSGSDTNDDDDGRRERVARQQALDAEIQQTRHAKGIPDNHAIVPVVVGGTSFYLQWLVHGRPDALRPTETALEKALTTITAYQENSDWTGALSFVKSMGDKFEQQADKLTGGDWYRLRRILEVAYTVEEKVQEEARNGSGTTVDALIDNLYSGQREGGLATMGGYDVRCFFLCPDDRMRHSQIVDERCEQMIVRGLLSETTKLAVAGELPEMAAKAIGYRQTLDYLQQQGQEREKNDNSDGDDHHQQAFGQFLEEFATATRRYAKRQMQWFRRDQEFVFVPMPMQGIKEERVEMAAAEILRLFALPRAEFDAERLDPGGISTTTRAANEQQGKGMKVYQFERKILVRESEALRNAVEEAKACQEQLQQAPAP